jgi:hypothetical protein
MNDMPKAHGELESEIQARILRYLRRTFPDAHIRKNHSQGRFATGGIPDIEMIVDGRAIFFEVKRPGGRPTRLQQETIRRLQAAGARAGVVTSVEETQALLEEWGILGTGGGVDGD